MRSRVLPKYRIKVDGEEIARLRYSGDVIFLARAYVQGGEHTEVWINGLQVWDSAKMPFEWLNAAMMQRIKEGKSDEAIAGRDCV